MIIFKKFIEETFFLKEIQKKLLFAQNNNNNNDHIKGEISCGYVGEYEVLPCDSFLEIFFIIFFKKKILFIWVFKVCIYIKVLVY